MDINSIVKTQEQSKEWAVRNAEDGLPNLSKLAIITNQTPRDLHCIMSEGEFEVDMLPFHWLPQNSDEFNTKSETEQKEIEKNYTYVVNEFISDTGILTRWLSISYC